MTTLFIISVVLLLLIQYTIVVLLIINQVLEVKYDLILSSIPIIGLIIELIWVIGELWSNKRDSIDLFKKGIKAIKHDT